MTTTTISSATLNTKRLTYEIERTGLTVPTRVRKRDGSLATFQPQRIEAAVARCFSSLEADPGIGPAEVAANVVRAVSARSRGATPTVEHVQDAVEFSLFSAGAFQAARHYITYREEHARDRATRPVPDEVRAAFDADRAHFPTAAQQFNFYDKYSRFNWVLGRRETWAETVDRAVAFLRELSGDRLPGHIYERVHGAILRMEVMPSMRLLATAGEAARRNHLAVYNCAYLPVRDLDAFVEALVLSMSGCGVGYSVERENVESFPRIKRQKRNQQVETHFVEDTTEGWADALRLGLSTWWAGEDVTFDYSLIRPAGTVLRTKGGRASGPEPLRAALDFARAKVLSRQGSFLRSLDAHDIMCVIGGAAVQGGVRRTAMIALFDWDDRDMLGCKTGTDLDANPHRWNANNSAVWPEDISDLDIIEQMTAMVRGQRGEPGIFSRANAVRTKPARRKKSAFGTNPCGEIFLRPYGMCNLSIAVARPGDTEDDLRAKVETATIIGTIQSLATNFPGMREEWRRNAEDERLLGVDLTGQVDNEMLGSVTGDGAALRERLRKHAVEANAEWADHLGINRAASVTCDKPSGNSSELLDSASGIHARHAPYYVRNIRVAATSPLFKVLRAAGTPMDPENGQTADDATTWVVHFPKKSPDGATVKADRSAVEQCEFWLLNKQHWTEHNPSCTVTYRPDEVMDLISWVVAHKDVIGGLSFLPASDAQYAQLPYQTVTAEEYAALAAEFPEVDYSKVYRYESEDMTTAAQELACMAGACEL